MSAGNWLACVAGGFRGCGRGVWGHLKSGQGEEAGGITQARNWFVIVIGKQN